MKFFKIIPLISILTLADQLSKSSAMNFLQNKFRHEYVVNEYLELVTAWNYGISFGLFSQHKHYSNYAFIAINCLIVGYLISMANSASNAVQRLAIGFIVGGAIGNLVDRFTRGAVFDFLYFHYKDFSFPAFNLADSFISFGVFLMIISLFQKKVSNP